MVVSCDLQNFYFSAAYVHQSIAVFEKNTIYSISTNSALKAWA